MGEVDADGVGVAAFQVDVEVCDWNVLTTIVAGCAAGVCADLEQCYGAGEGVSAGDLGGEVVAGDAEADPGVNGDADLLGFLRCLSGRCRSSRLAV